MLPSFKSGRLGATFDSGRLGDTLDSRRLGDFLDFGRLGDNPKSGRLGDNPKSGRLGDTPEIEGPLFFIFNIGSGKSSDTVLEASLLGVDPESKAEEPLDTT
jgi:hypothetical protein